MLKMTTETFEFVTLLLAEKYEMARHVLLDDKDHYIDVNINIYDDFHAIEKHQEHHLISSPLMIACSGHDLLLVDELLKRGAKVNFWCDDDFNPLINSIHTKNIEIIKKLLAHGADIECYYAEDGNALYYAVVSGELEIVVLLANKLKPEILHAYLRNFLMEYATQKKDLALYQYLSGRGISEISPAQHFFEKMGELGVNFDHSIRSALYWATEFSASKIYDFVFDSINGLEEIKECVLALQDMSYSRKNGFHEIPYVLLSILTKEHLNVIRALVIEKHLKFGESSREQNSIFLSKYISQIDSHLLSVNLSEVVDSVKTDVIEQCIELDACQSENSFEQPNTL
ncbi:MAG: ankyrin repeat domain-containing protein [Endozoicomonadaceae bacterium]|nr:ankyrin repeat domain-containing protein [Endozoicomonadaceae bacterium]